MQYRFIFIYILLPALFAVAPVDAGDNGERFKAGNLDAETAVMLNVPPDKTQKSIVGTETVSGDDSESAHGVAGVSVENIATSDKIPGDVESDIEENTLLAYIPEHEYQKDGRRRREMTKELAIEYPTGKFMPREVGNNAWGVGEKLTFQVTYGFYQAGTATMSVLGKMEVNGSECYHIQTKANSNKFISAFYKVRDSVDSFIDVQGIFSRRFEKRLREGSYKADRIVDFYHDRLLALNTRQKIPYTEVPLYVQDILSSLYYLRTIDLEVGKHQEFDAYADGKVYPLKVLVHKREKIEVPAGKFTCLKVEPVLKSEGIFRQKGKLTVWLTDDEYKMPVKMESKIAIGSIATQLEKYERTEK